MSQDSQPQRAPARSTGGDASPDALVVDLGKQTKKQVQRLFAGEGDLYAEVKSLMGGLRTSGKLPAGAVPVVVVVRQKRGGKKKSRSPFPGL
jgi:hypothetical protein